MVFRPVFFKILKILNNDLEFENSNLIFNNFQTWKRWKTCWPESKMAQVIFCQPRASGHHLMHRLISMYYKIVFYVCVAPADSVTKLQ